MQGHYMDTVWHYAPDSKKRSPQGRWRNRSESHVEKHRKRSFGAPLGSFWVSLGSIAGPFVSFGVPLGDPSGLLWNPLGLLRGSFGAPWGNPSGVLWGVLWSFGIPLGTKGGPSGKQMRPSGTKWEPNESKWEPSVDQLGPSGGQMAPCETKRRPKAKILYL